MKTGKSTYAWSLTLIGLAVFWPSNVPVERLVAVLQALPALAV